MYKGNLMSSIPCRNHPLSVLSKRKPSGQAFIMSNYLPVDFGSRRRYRVLKKEEEANRFKNRQLFTPPHEFKSPLEAIMHSAEFIERNLGSPDQKTVRRQLQNIKTAASFMTMLFNDYLSAGQSESGAVHPNFSKMNLKAHVEEVIAEMKSQAKDWQDIRYTHKGEQTLVLADKNLLHHCLTNLISNAIKYSDAVNHIDVITQVEGNSFSIIIKDSGIGIPAEETTNIFKPFFRASNADCADGSGLGLSVVKTYTELMGGKISFKTELGKGTTFELKFDSTAVVRNKKRRNTVVLKH
ncbi:MAG: sensor histidine kinase [Mucilaginibacter sp.]